MKPIAATFESFRTLADRGCKLTFFTQELTDKEELSNIISRVHSFGYLAFLESSDKVDDLELPDFKPEFRDDKTPSKRLRNVLYRVWEHETTREQPFDDWYKVKMESIIEYYKGKLE